MKKITLKKSMSKSEARDLEGVKLSQIKDSICYPKLTLYSLWEYGASALL